MTKQYNSRYLTWCQETGRSPEQPFSAHEFTAWIGRKWREFREQTGYTGGMPPNGDFDKWLEKGRDKFEQNQLDRQPNEGPGSQVYPDGQSRLLVYPSGEQARAASARRNLERRPS